MCNCREEDDANNEVIQSHQDNVTVEDDVVVDELPEELTSDLECRAFQGGEHLSPLGYALPLNFFDSSTIKSKKQVTLCIINVNKSLQYICICILAIQQSF